jgi:acetylornithine deacetylase
MTMRTRDPATAIDDTRLESILKALIDIYSPSGKEHQVVDTAAAILREGGVPLELCEVDRGRCNIEVSGGGAVDLAFVGHLDTVPAFDMDTLPYRRIGDRVAGLGAADMKGGCAAMMEAFIAARSAGILPAAAGLFLVVGEEESGDGTADLLSRRRFGTALVAEPTDLMPCLAHCGYVEVQVRAFGDRRHAAMAGREVNAIHGMLAALQRLSDWVEKEHPAVVLNIRDLHSSESGFAVPDRCVADLDLHLPPQTDLRVFLRDARAVLDGALAGSAVSRYEINVPTEAAGYVLPAGDPLARIVQAACTARGLPFQPATFMSHSDANLLHDAGCSTVILGPGQLARAHTRDESVGFAQVCAAASLYLDVLARWPGTCPAE